MQCIVTNSKGGRCDRDAHPIWGEMCPGHGARLKAHGDTFPDRPIRDYTKSEHRVRPQTPGATVEARFWFRVKRTVTCWLWDGTVLNSGYGSLWNGSTTVTAHRYSWTLAFGSIRPGARVRQTCGNRLCVKPAHLEMVGGVVRQQREEMAAA